MGPDHPYLRVLLIAFVVLLVGLPLWVFVFEPERTGIGLFFDVGFWVAIAIGMVFLLFGFWVGRQNGAGR